MSVGRKNWSALSSLARQRTLEDEEEQERERRRRHRNLSSTTEEDSPRLTQNGEQRAAERLLSVEEAEAPPPPPPASKDEDEDEDVQAILRSRKERRQRQRQQAAEAALQAPVQERPEAEAGRDSVDAGQAAQQPPVPRKEPEPPPHQRLSREQRGLWAQGEEESSAGKKEVPEKTPALEKAPVPEEKTLAPEKRLVSEQSSASGQPPVPEKSPRPRKSAEPQKRGVQEEAPPEETSASEKAPAKPAGSGGRRVLERASIFEKPLLSDKSLATEAKPAPKRAAASEQGAPAGSPATAKAPVPPPGASRLPPITLQVKIPSREEEADTSSPSQLTYSSSLKRSSPRTISFRMSPRKDNSETTLTRSASVRLPASSAKLGEKLERYHTAIQRSESVRSSGSSRAEVFVAPAGVASKRHLFEKELVGQSRPEPASSRKENLRLSGVVTSKLNLWISRTQESGEQDPQEVRREAAATRRTQRGKKPEASFEVEV